MSAGVGVLRRVPVRGAIAAPRAATRLASAKVNPDSSDLHALVTLTNLRAFDLVNFIDVFTTLFAHDAYYRSYPIWMTYCLSLRSGE